MLYVKKTCARFCVCHVCEVLCMSCGERKELIQYRLSSYQTPVFENKCKLLIMSLYM